MNQTPTSHKHSQTARTPRKRYHADCHHLKILTLTSTFLLPSYASTHPATPSSLGDGIRSSSSSSTFFKSIDRDGDGMLRAPEISSFLSDHIGGSAFDTSSEVDTEVVEVMKSLDRNHDEGLDKSDVYAHWSQLESLLTADEVAEWVVHAVQLPESVGAVFRENVVTGYDFPELVENDGESMMVDLGIIKSTWRKKIVRHIHARMLGIGDKPGPPTNIRHKLESCGTVSFTWEKPSARGFPVHSYRVQRRAVEVTVQKGQKHYNNNSSGDNGNSRSIFYDKSLTCQAFPTMTMTEPFTTAAADPELFHKISSSNWVTVYSGAEPAFHDDGLTMEHKYIYRVQAWNNVGRSPWVEVDIFNSQKRLNCLDVVVPNNRKPRGIEAPIAGRAATYRVLDREKFSTNDEGYWPGPYAVVQFFLTFTRGIFTLTAVAAALMRLKRASVTSTMKTNSISFSALLNGINYFFRRLLGIDILPSFMLCDFSTNTDDSNSDSHDVCMKTTKLRGYKKDNFLDEDDTPEARRVKFVEKNCRNNEKKHSFDNIETTSDSNAQMFRRNLLRKTKSLSALKTDDSESTTTQKSTRLLRNGTPRCKASKSLPSEDVNSHEVCSFLEDSDRELQKLSCVSCDDTTNQFIKAGTSKTVLKCNNNNTNRKIAIYDDHTVCNSCRKKYKLGVRFRHHCARCLSTFCHKHGKTTHNNFTSCKVPGTCICQVCLDAEKI